MTRLLGQSAEVAGRLLLLLLLAPSIVVAQDGDPEPTAEAAGDAPADESPESPEIAALRARIGLLRADMQRLFKRSESAHAELRAEWLARDRATPKWVREGAAGVALERVAETARQAKPRAADVAAASVALVASAPERWRSHVSALLPHVVAEAAAEPEADVRALYDDLVARALDDDDFTAVWDAWFQRHAVVTSWRDAHAELTALLEAAQEEKPADPDVRPAPPVAEPPAPAVEPEAPVADAEPTGTPSTIEETVLVSLARGTFRVGPWRGWLGDLSEREQRGGSVSVKTLHVDRHEVTVGQYAAFLDAVPADERSPLLPDGWVLDAELVVVAPEGKTDHPVTGVSFLQASAYAAAQGKRLPTENEWERIAAAGDADRVFPWGGSVEGVEFACREQGDEDTSPVLAFEADRTPEGVIGLAGNVKEMVATQPDGKDVKRRVNADDRVVIRGGGFRTRAEECDTRWRWVVEAGRGEPDVGFRCVMDDLEFRRRR